MRVDEAGYQQWRAAKLENYPCSINDLQVNINVLEDPGKAGRVAITGALKRANMAIYKCRKPNIERQAVVAFAATFGLQHLDHHLCANADGVSELTVANSDVRVGYVPYSNRSLSWHTDGYYNDKPRQINAVVLHCVTAAPVGGENNLLDPEMVYLRLRDENPQFIRALEHPDCMTIPANRDAGGQIRPAVSGPVFSFDRSGNLHMRYSARKRNICWRDDPATRRARDCLTEILADEETPVFHYRLQAGEGLISNNVLHNRTTFEDGPTQKRLLYRARFFERCNARRATTDEEVIA